MPEPLILALETSSRRGSVALGRPPAPPRTRVLRTDRTHTAELLPAIADLLREAHVRPDEVAVVAFSRGPGSFTGLRVGVTVARTWHSATRARLVALDTLDVLAREASAHAQPDTPVAIGVSAGAGRVFGGLYQRCKGGGATPAGEVASATPLALHEDDGGPGAECLAPGWQVVDPPRLRDAAEWCRTLPPGCAATGDWVAGHGEALQAAGVAMLPEACWLPDATDVWALAVEAAAAGRFCRPEDARPLYPRPPECEEVYEQRRLAARARRGVS